MERRLGFANHTGVETSDLYIRDRIAELTGVENHVPITDGSDAQDVPEDRGVGGRLYLTPKFDIDFFKGKRCLDLGCGAGRWTKTLKTLGATVKSVDVSPAALESTRRFNDDVESLNLFDIIEGRPDLHEAFDFVLCWGVVMCTHDPKLAFQNVARTVKPGGTCYVMVYAPTYHASPFVLENRKKYHRELKTNEERLELAYALVDNKRNAINALDMLNTYYNWVIDEPTLRGWFSEAGFAEPTWLNEKEPYFCAYHMVGVKK